MVTFYCEFTVSIYQFIVHIEFENDGDNLIIDIMNICDKLSLKLYIYFIWFQHCLMKEWINLYHKNNRILMKFFSSES
jgi:hypothetical protein